MKRAALLVVLASMTGAALAQDKDRSEWLKPAFDTHQPLGSSPLPDLPPADPKDEYRLVPAPTVPSYRSQRYNSDVDVELARKRAWRQQVYQADHPYQTNFGGDPSDRSGRTTTMPTRRSTASPYSSVPNRSTGSSGSNSYGREYPRGDPNWLRSNFGGAPQPRATPTHPYSFNTPQPRATTGLYGVPPKRCGSRSPYSFSPC